MESERARISILIMVVLVVVVSVLSVWTVLERTSINQYVPNQVEVHHGASVGSVSLRILPPSEAPNSNVKR